jgi:flagellar basal-body rod protein FlgF
MGEGGPISIPPDMNITIAKEGTVSLVPNIPPPNAVTTVGRIKLVNPDPQQLTRGEDGLFRLRGGGAAAADPGVVLASGVLEGSNVNVVDQLVSMISLARQYDLQMKLLSSADNSANQASQILNIRA